MYNIKFKYRDKHSNWEWREQQCTMNSVEDCKRVYGLGIDCDYEIISIEPAERKKERNYSRLKG